MTLFRLGVALFITAAVISATTFWWWALRGMSYEVAVAWFWTLTVICAVATTVTLAGLLRES